MKLNYYIIPALGSLISAKRFTPFHIFIIHHIQNTDVYESFLTTSNVKKNTPNPFTRSKVINEHGLVNLT